jgi:hypothetical protein
MHSSSDKQTSVFDDKETISSILEQCTCWKQVPTSKFKPGFERKDDDYHNAIRDAIARCRNHGYLEIYGVVSTYTSQLRSFNPVLRFESGGGIHLARDFCCEQGRHAVIGKEPYWSNELYLNWYNNSKLSKYC